MAIAITCPAGLDGQTAEIENARAVYGAVLDRLLRSEPADSVVALDSTIPMPGFILREATAGRRLQDQLRQAMASTPGTALPVLDDSSVGRITKAHHQRLQREVPTRRYKTLVTVVSLSAVFMHDQGERALVYVERWQGPNWSSGRVMELERHDGVWVITGEWGQWAT